MIAEAAIAGVTAITLGCLWLSSKVVQAVLEDEEPFNLYPFRDVFSGHCALCNRTFKGETLRWASTLKSTRTHYVVTCAICGRTFNMQFANQPPRPGNDQDPVGRSS